MGGMLVENPYHQRPDELLTEEERSGGVTANPEIEKAAQWYFDVTTGST
jgi:hypothetical protein